MNEASLDNAREELATLEAAEARVSAERRHLHRQIDFGYATESARLREREVSDERRELHRQIDALRELLGLPPVRGTGSNAGGGISSGTELLSIEADRDLPIDAG
jgi:uncharacterized protein YlxW (UPF0749 family)